MAITTFYKGYCFRSRLEAKWAAYFDLLKLPWLYEPKDLEWYIPDFIIDGLLVEVKGCGSIQGLEEHIDKIIRSGWKGPWVIVGDSPHIQLGKPIAINDALWAEACNRVQWKGGWEPPKISTPEVGFEPGLFRTPVTSLPVSQPPSIGLPGIRETPMVATRNIESLNPRLPGF